MRFYDKLFALQKALKIKKTALARESGIDQSSVSKYFLGKRPLPLKYVSTICTMPKVLLSGILSRANVTKDERERIMTARALAETRMRLQLTAGKLDEMAMVASDARLDAGEVLLDIPAGLLSLAYTPEEYAVHLAYVRQMGNEILGYRFYELDESPFHNIKVFSKSAEVIVQKSGDPAAVFAIENIYMCRGFTQFLAELKED